MNIAHFAAHTGNFGDLLSSASLYRYFESASKLVHVKKIEIRDYYMNGPLSGRLSDEVEKYLNRGFKVIIGGGGFLTPYSGYLDNQSKCLIDFKPSLLKSDLLNNIAMVSIGYEGSLRDCNKSIIEKHVNYLKMLKSRNVPVILRKDAGTRFLVESNYFKAGTLYDDFGFNSEFVNLPKGREIVLCPSGGRGGEGWESDEYTLHLAGKMIDEAILCNLKVNIVLNTIFDLKVAGKLTEKYKSITERRMINIVYAGNEDVGLSGILDVYRRSLGVFSGRYHGLAAGYSQKCALSSPKVPEKAAIAALEYDGLVICDEHDVIKFIDQCNKKRLFGLSPDEATVNCGFEVLEGWLNG